MIQYDLITPLLKKAPMKRAFIELHLSVLLAGFTGLFGRLITMNEGVLVWWRVFIASVLFYIILKAMGIFKRYPLPDLIRMGVVGSLLCVHWVFFYGSIKAANVSVGVVCYSLTGFFTALLEPLILKRRFSVKELFFGSMAVLGILLIFHFDSRYRLGIALGVMSSLWAALFTIGNKVIIPRYPSMPVLLFYEITGGLVFLTLLAPVYLFFVDVGPLLPDGMNFFWLVIFAFFCTILLQWFQINALQKISAFTVNLSYNLEPIYTIILASLFFGEMNELTIAFFAGLGIIMLSVLLQMWSVLRRGT